MVKRGKEKSDPAPFLKLLLPPAASIRKGERREKKGEKKHAPLGVWGGVRVTASISNIHSK